MTTLTHDEFVAMDPSEIYAKTELGLQELKERKLNLPITLRGLLILIDGNRTVAEVLVKARALKLDERAMTALERGGLIAKRFSAPSVAHGEASAAPVQRSALLEMVALAGTRAGSSRASPKERSSASLPWRATATCAPG